MIAGGSVGFGEAHFGTAVLGHKDRTDCLVRIANLMHRHPGGTLPHKLMSPKDYKAMDRLANRPEVTHAAVLCPHRERTLTLMRETAGVVLLLHDTTELDYSGLSIPELGPIGSGYHRGYLCHNSLAVAFEEREVLGLVNQVLHARVPVPKNETIKAKRKRQSRESRLWTQAVQNIEVAPVDRLWIDIADRGADVLSSWRMRSPPAAVSWCVPRPIVRFRWAATRASSCCTRTCVPCRCTGRNALPWVVVAQRPSGKRPWRCLSQRSRCRNRFSVAATMSAGRWICGASALRKLTRPKA